MRHTLSIYLVILAFATSSNLTTAQVVEVAENFTPYTAFERIVPLGQNWAVAYRYNGLSIRNSEGEMLNSVFTPMWINPLAGGWESMGDMIPTADGGLFLVGPSFGCDYVGMNTLMRLDANGSTLWTKEEIESNWWLSHLALEPQDRLALVSPTDVVITDLDGNVSGQWEIDLENIRRAIWTPANDLLVASEDSLVLFNGLGEWMMGGAIEGIIDVRSHGTGSLVLTTSAIHVLDGDLALVTSDPLPPDAGTPCEFVPGSSGFIIRTDSAFLSWSEDQGVVELFQPALAPGQVINSTWYADGRYLTVGVIQGNQRRSGYFRTYASDGSTSEHYEDVALELTVDTIWFEGPNGNYFYHRADVTVRLSVIGAAVINDVIVTHEEYVPVLFDCVPPSRTVRLQNMTLAPGSDTTFVMEGLWISASPTPPGSTISTEVCVVAQRPNHVADRDPTDNKVCASGTFLTNVGIHDQTTTAPKIFPNPFNDRINLAELPGGTATIELFDASGRQVFQKVGTANELRVVMFPQLSYGHYQLLIRTEEGFISQKLVKGSGR
ncbi:MAG: T9SS type A sorting domain-containing protein [Flavobacteriales bacterium]|nr:T9SS type A sorting domain-containing protein [Flavobacteriales bacterium]